MVFTIAIIAEVKKIVLLDYRSSNKIDNGKYLLKWNISRLGNTAELSGTCFRMARNTYTGNISGKYIF